MQSEIKKWGNSAAIRIPSRILAQANLTISSHVHMTVVNGQIVIEVAKAARKLRLPFNESMLLNGLDAHTAHVDEIAIPSRSEMGAK